MKMSGGGNKSQGLPATTNKTTGSLIRHIMKEAYSNPKQRSGGSQEQQETPSVSYQVSNLSNILYSQLDYVANNNSLTTLLTAKNRIRRVSYMHLSMQMRLELMTR